MAFTFKKLSSTKSKQCPLCNRIYPKDNDFCTIDGTKLVSYKQKNSPDFIKFSSMTIVVTIIFLLFVINLIPHAMKWMASNCDVTLSGLSLPNNKTTASAIEDVVDSFTSIFTTQSTQPKPKVKEKKNEKESGDIVLHLSIHNKNPLPVNILKLEVDLKINGNPYGSGKIAHDSVNIGSWEIQEIQFPLSISLTSMLTSAGDMIFSKKFTYRAIGHIKVEFLFASIQYPLDIKGINIPIM